MRCWLRRNYLIYKLFAIKIDRNDDSQADKSIKVSYLVGEVGEEHYIGPGVPRNSHPVSKTRHMAGMAVLIMRW